MTAPKFIDIPPLITAQGTVSLPGSKSISNRVLLLAALSEGTTEVRDVLRSDDTARMQEGLQALGVVMGKQGDHVFRVQGCGGRFPARSAELFLGNAGTAFRPLAAVLALSGGHYALSGVPRMHERPIADLVDALRDLGANIRYTGKNGFPPLEILPADIKSVNRISVRGDVSSQFLTALLMAAPLLQQELTLDVEGELISRPYIEITLKLMERFGVKVERTGWTSFRIPRESRYKSPGLIFVEGDASSASYFLAAGALGGGPVRVEGVGSASIQGDKEFGAALVRMGARQEWGENWMEMRAPESGKLKPLDLDCNHIPDAAMTLAVVALFADGTTTLRNIASWRVKETDRIHAMSVELRKFGANVEEGPDFIRITPPASTLASPVHPPPLSALAAIDTYDDHRMAMCFSLAALGGSGVRINDPHCVAKTFPDYFERFARCTRTVPVIAIDGPSASGKGTVAQGVAAELGFHFLDSGSLYRLLALSARHHGIPLDAEARLADLAARMDIRFEWSDIWLDGERVGEALRSEQVAAMASSIAALPAVRAALLERQRAFRRAPGLVADGRDMASIVFPDAVLKVFLTASAEARAERRYKQLIEKGMRASIDTLLQEIRARDERDSKRSVAPLQQALGAGLLDTTDLTVDQAVQEVLKRYRVSAA